MKRKLDLSILQLLRMLGNKKAFLLTFILLQFISLPIFAQSRIIHGIVSDANGPLVNVSVIVKGSSAGVNTDDKGRFSISAPQTAILIFSFVGYRSQSIEVKGRDNINMLWNQIPNHLEK